MTATPDTPFLSIVIPNWNGERFLPRCLAAARMSAAEYGHTFECVLVDDCSTDGGVALVERDFPWVRVLRNPANVGFGNTANRGVQEARGDVVVLLNNDLVARAPLISELVQPLVAEPSLFGVSGKTIDWGANAPNHVNMAAQWERGDFRVVHRNSTTAEPTLFLLGGCCALRRAEFLRLGGFHPLFSPGYWEDYDISYLAAKAGWHHLYQPKAEAYHFGQGSMNAAFGSARVRAIRRRNARYFSWLNLTDDDYLREHTSRMPREAWAGLMQRGDAMDRLRGLAAALPQLPAVQKERERRAGLIRRTDREVLAEFASWKA